MGILLVAIAIGLSIVTVSCAKSEDLRDGDGPPPPALEKRERDTPTSTSVTPRARTTPLSTATPSLPTTAPATPVVEATVAVPREPPPTPPPFPQVSLEYGGRSYQGWRGSYCWPTSGNSVLCADSVGWQGFDEASAVSIKRGDQFSIKISGSDPASDEFRVRVSTPQETKLAVRPGEELFSSDSLEGLKLDLSAGIYFVHIFYKSQLGDVSYGFKIELHD